MRSLVLAFTAAAFACSAPAAHSRSLLDYVGECVPFARQASGIQIYGDAWTWWDKAEGRYARGREPGVGAVLVFAKWSRLPYGHVAVVSRIVNDRVLMVTHANWSRIGGERGHVERDVTLLDVSPAGDWSRVRGPGIATTKVWGRRPIPPTASSTARPRRERRRRSPRHGPSPS